MKTSFEQATHANYHSYSDVTPFEIVKKVSEKTIDVREMDYKALNSNNLDFHAGGFSAHCSNQYEQKYSYEANEENPIIRIRLHMDGHYYCKHGKRHTLSTQPVRFYDYNF